MSTETLAPLASLDVPETLPVNVIVSPVNDAPVITAQIELVTPEDTELGIELEGLIVTDIDLSLIHISEPTRPY